MPAAGKSRTSELVLRIVSAAALAPIAIGAAYLGGAWFAAFWLIAAIGVLWEWATLLGADTATTVTAIGAGALVLATGSLVFGVG